MFSGWRLTDCMASSCFFCHKNWPDHSARWAQKCDTMFKPTKLSGIVLNQTFLDQFWSTWFLFPNWESHSISCFIM
jgi:hypothetical protein